jgi:hypothetical protein
MCFLSFHDLFVFGAANFLPLPYSIGVRMAMDKLQLTGQYLSRGFNSRSGRVYAMHTCCC